MANLAALHLVAPAVCFHAESKSDGIELLGKPPVVAVVSGDGDGWRAAKTAQRSAVMVSFIP